MKIHVLIGQVLGNHIFMKGTITWATHIIIKTRPKSMYHKLHEFCRPEYNKLL